MLGIIGKYLLLFKPKADGVQIFDIVIIFGYERGINLGANGLGHLFVLLKVGDARPPHEQVVRQRVPGHLVAELIEVDVVL